MIWWLDAKPVIRAASIVSGYHPMTTSVPKIKDWHWGKDEEQSACIIEQLLAIYEGWDTSKYPSWWKQGEVSR